MLYLNLAWLDGGDSCALLNSSETAVLHSALVFSVKEKHGAVGTGPEGHKTDQRTGRPHPWREAEMFFLRLMFFL